MCQVSSWRTNQTYFHVLWSPSSPDFHLSTHPHWMVFLSKSPVCSSTRLSVFLCCRTISVQQSYFPCFLLHKTSVEYTRFYSAITEMLLYTVEPRMSYYDVFSKCCSVVSNPVGVWVLLKLYTPFVYFLFSIVQHEQYIPLHHTTPLTDMYLSPSLMLYSTAVLRSRNHLFSRNFHYSTNHLWCRRH